jgi:hypothetical protein
VRVGFSLTGAWPRDGGVGLQSRSAEITNRLLENSLNRNRLAIRAGGNESPALQLMQRMIRPFRIGSFDDD